MHETFDAKCSKFPTLPTIVMIQLNNSLMLDLSLSIPAQSMSFVLIPSWHSLVIHNDIADTHKTNTYLNNILVIEQDKDRSQ